MSKRQKLGAIASVLLLLTNTPVVHAQSQQQSAIGFDFDAVVDQSGEIQVNDLNTLNALGYDPSRRFQAGQTVGDALQLGDLQGFVNLNGSLADAIGIENAQNLSLEDFGLADNVTLGDLANDPATRNLQVSDIAPIASLLSGNIDASFQVLDSLGTQIPELEDFLNDNPNLRNLPLSSIVNADFSNFNLNANQAHALEAIAQALPDNVLNIPAGSIAGLSQIVHGDFAGGIQSGIGIAAEQVPEVAQFLEDNPGLRDIPVGAILNGDVDGIIAAGQTVGLRELASAIPELEGVPLGEALGQLQAGDYSGAISNGVAIARERVPELERIFADHPELEYIPIDSLLRGDVNGILSAAELAGLDQLTKEFPELEGVPLGSALQNLRDGNIAGLAEQGIAVAQDKIPAVAKLFEDHPELADIPIGAILNGDVDGIIAAGETVGLRELIQEVPELEGIALGGILRGNTDAIITSGLNVGVRELVEKYPALENLGLGALVNKRTFTVGDVPGLATRSIKTIKAFEGKKAKDVPGLSTLNRIPIDNVIATFLNGDLFGRFDLGLSGEERAYNVISGGMIDGQFIPMPCQVGVTPDTKTCANIELQDTGNDHSLGGKTIVLGDQQQVPGGRGILKKIANGKEMTGWMPWGANAIEEGTVKIVALGLSEGGGSEAASSKFELRAGFCIKKLFVDLGCTPNFIPIPFPLHPKVSEQGKILVASNNPAPDISSYLDAARNGYGFGDECYPSQFQNQSADPGNSENPGIYEEANSKDLVEVGTYNGEPQRLHRQTADNFRSLQEAAASEGIHLTAGSGFRSIDTQQGIVDTKRAEGQTDEEIFRFSTRPGESEHHTGRVVDVVATNNPATDFQQSFADTPEGRWIAANAGRFGFELSYPNQVNPGGIGFEPWHLRDISTRESRVALNLETRTNSGPGNAAIASVGRTSGDIGSVDTNAWGTARDRANLILTSILESDGIQNQVDVAVSIQNRVTDSRYPNNATDVTFAPDQYQPNFGRVPVNTKDEAISRLASVKYGSVAAAATAYESLERALSDPLNIVSAQNFIGGATDFRGPHPTTRQRASDPFRGGGGANFFLAESRSASRARATLERLGLNSGSFQGINDPGGGFFAASACVTAATKLLGVRTPLVQGNGLATGTFGNPTNPRDTEFSDYFAQYHPRRGRAHTGVDLASSNGRIGAPIAASDGGTVSYIQYDPNGYGNYVIIDHGNGFASLYAHLESYQVRLGDRLSKGQNFAVLGSSGRSTGPHLHFEIRQNYQGGFSGVPIDPEALVNLRL